MSPRPSRPLAMRAARTLLYRSRIARTRLRRAISAIGAAVNDHPIFILGMQKAGTSAVAHLLGERTASTTTVDFFDEVYDPVYPRLVRGEISTREYVLRNRLDFSRDIIKEPNLTLLYRQLLEHFPAARFVFVVRDPRDNIRSLLNHV
ncbi:MAG: hypothetical protein JXB36_15210, partial [Gammaproteobacteria bacterium]|nr:hypothetical protein [Gammaproteobacteria bacterium]